MGSLQPDPNVDIFRSAGRNRRPRLSPLGLTPDDIRIVDELASNAGASKGGDRNGDDEEVASVAGGDWQEGGGQMATGKLLRQLIKFGIGGNLVASCWKKCFWIAAVVVRFREGMQDKFAGIWMGVPAQY